MPIPGAEGEDLAVREGWTGKSIPRRTARLNRPIADGKSDQALAT